MPSGRTPIAIFARPPVPGHCKTRLAAVIGAERATALYEAFVLDVLATVRSEPALAPELHVTGAPDHPFFLELVARFELPPPRRQVAGDLGARMQRALDRGEPALLIGTDVPTLPCAILRAARQALGDHDVVLSPTGDGGYALVGTSGRAPRDFLSAPGIRWSSPHALADTLRAARAAGCSVGLTEPVHDVDEPPDLAVIAAQLALDPGAAPVTASRLRSSAF